MTREAHDTTPGYIFVAPQEGDTPGVYVPPGTRTYKAFRFAWNTHPSDRPAVAAERVSEEEVEVHTSWNGTTEIVSWSVLAGALQDQLEALGAAPSDGFEADMVARTPICTSPCEPETVSAEPAVPPRP